MRSRSFSTSLASRKTNALASMVTKVSIISGGGAVILEGPVGIGLGGRASAAGGDAGGVGSLYDSIGLLTLGVGGVGGISRRIGQGSKSSPLTL